MDDRTKPDLPFEWPSLHVVRAALHAAEVIDDSGSIPVDADESHWNRATGGVYPPQDLARGRELLLQCGLVVERRGKLYRTAQLDDIVAAPTADAVSAVLAHIGTDAPLRPDELDDHLSSLVPDPKRREEILLALGNRFDDCRNRAVGALGERAVLDAARAELVALGRDDLADQVRRVSLISDQLGYDISAPSINGQLRLLEVKTTTQEDDAGAPINVFISRNEFETGIKFPSWSLVVCRAIDVDKGVCEILGHCSAQSISELMPQNRSGGSWEQVRVELPRRSLIESLPSPLI